MTRQVSAIIIDHWQTKLVPALTLGGCVLANHSKDRLDGDNQLALADEELVRLTLRGNKQAYERLVRRYQKLVYNVAFQITRTHETAADLTQETFLRAYRGLSSFDQSANFKPWLLRIATNAALNSVRDQKEHLSLDSVLEEQPDMEPVSKSNIELEVELRLSQHMLFDALATLPVRHRSAFLLRYQHDLSLAEIAYVLKESESSIKALLFRIREKLRKQLLHQFNQDYSQYRVNQSLDEV
jgi:RNA polymerase sigma-70 factor (ECF subfamily)